MIQDSRVTVFPYIDILRGFAAITVLIYHVIEHFNWHAFPSSGPMFWFRIGWVGVDLFFVISGFVITLSAIRLYKKMPDFYHGIFIKRRLLRIAPLYYLTLFCFIVFVSPTLLWVDFYENLGLHLFFIHNLSPEFQGAINGVNWSIAVEMQFYLIMLLLGPYLLRIGVFQTNSYIYSIGLVLESFLLLFGLLRK